MNNPDARDSWAAGDARGRGERGPGRGFTVERREAPHPYVTGVQRALARRAADRVMVRQADRVIVRRVPLAQGARRLPALHVPRQRETEKGNGPARQPEKRSRRAAQRWLSKRLFDT